MMSSVWYLPLVEWRIPFFFFTPQTSLHKQKAPRKLITTLQGTGSMRRCFHQRTVHYSIPIHPYQLQYTGLLFFPQGAFIQNFLTFDLANCM